ncbi:hypothetical protein K466DRAFT_656568 [Polyporus arcularius HHB13444]|uniref:Uncharacterized protein n=1 Tax=Polyporus arcularius HHB13444 TaxID=1314778 RepID=A0A5C3NT17_9APHY|nr:hypothetical protein K466DRAFT_656568 [Polyporus arcularius HHB13444]
MGRPTPGSARAEGNELVRSDYSRLERWVALGQSRRVPQATGETHRKVGQVPRCLPRQDPGIDCLCGPPRSADQGHSRLLRHRNHRREQTRVVARTHHQNAGLLRACGGGLRRKRVGDSRSSGAGWVRHSTASSCGLYDRTWSAAAWNDLTSSAHAMNYSGLKKCLLESNTRRRTRSPAPAVARPARDLTVSVS